METVNGQKSRTSAETTVTTEKTADLIKEDEISAWTLVEKGPSPSQLRLTVRGVVANSEIKMVGVSYAGVNANVPVDEKVIFRIEKTYDIFSPLDVVTVTATASNGNKHVIHKKLGVDFFDDTSVKAVRNGNDVVIQANKGTAETDYYLVYLIDGNKLIPLVEQQKPEPSTYKRGCHNRKRAPRHPSVRSIGSISGNCIHHAVTTGTHVLQAERNQSDPAAQEAADTFATSVTSQQKSALSTQKGHCSSLDPTLSQARSF